MNDDRNKKRPNQDRHERDQSQQALAAAQEQRRDEDGHQRKPSPIEKREWRGSGVCGDRHTD